MKRYFCHFTNFFVALFAKLRRVENHAAGCYSLLISMQNNCHINLFEITPVLLLALYRSVMDLNICHNSHNVHINSFVSLA